MSDNFSNDIDVTDPNDLEDPIDRMIKDIVDYNLNSMPVSEMLAIVATYMSEQLENTSLMEVQQIHTGIYGNPQDIH